MRAAGLVLLAIWGSGCVRAAPPRAAVTPPLIDPKGHPWVAPAPAPGEATLHGEAAERSLVLERVEGSALFAEDPFALSIHVTADRLTLADSCSTAQIGYHYARGVLEARNLPQLASTRQDCTERSRARVAWLADLLRSRPRVELPSGGLTFTGAQGSATFADAPSYPLVGTPWALVSCTALADAGSCRDGAQATLTLRDDGRYEAGLPCAVLTGGYTLDGNSLTLGAPGPVGACSAAADKSTSALLTQLLTSGPWVASLKRERLGLSGNAGRIFMRAAAAPVRSTSDFTDAAASVRALD